MSKTEQINALAQKLDQAAVNATSIPQIASRFSVDLHEAYLIQKASIDRRIARGEELVGYKLGFTSKAKMEQMGVHDVIWGRLTNTMHIASGGVLRMKDFIHPRGEPEVCFRFSKPVHQKLTLSEAYEAIDMIAPAVEVIDSRFENFQFSLEDVVADNCSSAAFVVGPWSTATEDLADLNIQLSIDGEVVHRGSSGAILGDPWESVVAMSRIVEKQGLTIQAGSILMAGAATPAEYLQPGQQVVVAIQQLGTVGFTTS